MAIPLNNPQNDCLQEELNKLIEWTEKNNMKINPQKTKEMIINFSKRKCTIPMLKINDQPIERVNEINLLGVSISNDLKWSSHIEKVTQKASQRIFVLTNARRAGASQEDMKSLYTSIIRPVLEYCCPVWSTSITRDLSLQLEQVQRRCLNIIHPNVTYEHALLKSNLNLLSVRRDMLCKKFFKSFINNEKTKNTLPPTKAAIYSLRTPANYETIKSNKERYRKSYIPFATRHY
jgi:hypothetical protein